MSEIQVKSEPVDPEYDAALDNGRGEPVEGQRIKTMLKGILDKSNQGQSVKNVIEELLQENEALVSQNDPIPFKPNPRTIYPKKEDTTRGSKEANIVRPKSPTRTCEIPQKDMSHIGQTLMELGVYDTKTEQTFSLMTHEMVCGVASKAFVTTQEGVNIQTDMQFYWCNFCPFKTELKQTLLQHVMDHRFHCKFCTYQSFSRADVIRHAAKEHDDFRSTAESLKYCTFLPDFLQVEVNSKKRKNDEENEPTVSKKAKSSKSGSKNKKDQISKAPVAETMFEMEVDEVDEDENESSEEESEPSEKVIVPRSQDKSSSPSPKPSASKENHKTPAQPAATSSSPQSSKSTPKQTPPSQKTSAKPSNTVTVSSGLCWNCGYCDFVTLSQSFLKTHLNTQHGGKAHKYVAMLVSSQDEMNKIKERDSQMYLSPNPSLLLGSPTVSSTISSTAPDRTVSSSRTDDNDENTIDSDSDEEYVPDEEKKKYPLTYKCAHCNFNAPVCFKIKEHLLFKHGGCVLYALDMRAVKLKQKRYVFFCHRQNCSFTTKKTEEYLNHSESCTPWLEPGCPEKIDSAAKKCLELTRNFSTKISQKAFQMARNFKSSKTAEYACVHCSYNSNNNTRVKKHVIANHKDAETVMRDLQASKMKKKTTVYFCKNCLWETRIDGDLEVHLKEKHNEDLPIQSSVSTPSVKPMEAVEDPPPLMPKIVSVTSGKKATSTSSVSSGSDNEDNIEQDGGDSEPDPPEPDEGLDDLEIPDEDIQRMMDEYITDEASRGKSTGRPNRAAAAKASARVQAQGHSPTLYKCLHCHHINFGENLMKRHITTVHPGVALRALDVKKRVHKPNPYVCFCPKELCKFVHSNEDNIAKHAEENHSIGQDSAEIKAILEPFVPASSPEKHVISSSKSTGAHYECLYCPTSVQRTTTLKMRQHVLAEHPNEDMIFRDCVLRRQRRACRVFMCTDITCSFHTTDQKEIALHNLAHDNARIYECSKCQWFTVTLDTVGAHMAALHQGEQVSTIEINLEIDSNGLVSKKVGGTVIKQEPE